MKINLPLLCRLLLMHYATGLGRFHLLDVLLNQIPELAPAAPLVSSEHSNDLGGTVRMPAGHCSDKKHLPKGADFRSSLELLSFKLT